ncbi:MAG: oxygen-independent coproporphyrinogen III oxidase [Cyclobacteriaceae bacterium]
MKNELITKYNVPGPRYTSYPTVPYWSNEGYHLDNWRKSVAQAFYTSGKEISLYIHLPFCESLCTYCACNTRITKNHSVEDRYIDTLLKEWQLNLSLMPGKPVLKDIHLGGGTPTFFSPKNLRRLISEIKRTCEISADSVFGFEGHPNNTTKQHLETMYQLGFRRVSFGIQDFDRDVQQLINRIQPFENVVRVTEQAREIGYTSINYDLVYGLPGQTISSVTDTLEKTIGLKPDRIALYGYAHVPWLKPAQNSFSSRLPSAEKRVFLYQLSKSLLGLSGYRDIGMDHFALPGDEMYQAAANGSLHRNFMGYSTQSTDLLIGLGVSAISDAWTAFSQNHKKLEDYYSAIENNELPMTRGHMLSDKDLLLRKHILNLMCRYQTTWREYELDIFGLDLNFELLEQLCKDGLIRLDPDGVEVLEKGRPFIRNICMAFDARMNAGEKKTFSKTL